MDWCRKVVAHFSICSSRHGGGWISIVLFGHIPLRDGAWTVLTRPLWYFHTETYCYSIKSFEMADNASSVYVPVVMNPWGKLASHGDCNHGRMGGGLCKRSLNTNWVNSQLYLITAPHSSLLATWITTCSIRVSGQYPKVMWLRNKLCQSWGELLRPLVGLSLSG